MDTLITIGALLCFVANLVHWRARKGERWSYYPRQGWPKFASHTALLSLPILAALALRGTVPMTAFVWIAFTFIIWHELYSICVRHALRKKNASSDPITAVRDLTRPS
jgi:hypothetical protein